METEMAMLKWRLEMGTDIQMGTGMGMQPTEMGARPGAEMVPMGNAAPKEMAKSASL